MKTKIIPLVLALLAANLFAQAEQWTLDKSHSSINFKVSHMVVSKTVGKFDKFDIDIQWDAKKVQNSSVKVTIDAASINTGDAKRDEHLRNADFFDVANHPTITFVSTKITPKGKDKALVEGKLTLKGVTKDTKIEFTGKGPIKNPYAEALKGGAEGKFKINRKEFGISYNSVLEAGGLAIGEEVEVEIQLEADLPLTKPAS